MILGKCCIPVWAAGKGIQKKNVHCFKISMAPDNIHLDSNTDKACRLEVNCIYPVKGIHTFTIII